MLGAQTGAMAGASSTGPGTFHAIGARLLREYARDIGIDPAFTIHDREDSADLMNSGAARTRLVEDAASAFR